MLNFSNINFEAAFGTFAQLPPSTLPEICFAGRSNVGKSSLINKVVSRKALARTSGQPGKTATVNFYLAKDLRLVDLPGYGYAKVPFSERDRWSELMEGYFGSERNIKMVFQLIDMRHPPSADDFAMIEYLKYMNMPFCYVLTKSDKLNKTEFSERMELITEELGDLYDGEPIIPFSAKSGAGAEEIKKIIESAL